MDSVKSGFSGTFHVQFNLKTHCKKGLRFPRANIFIKLLLKMVYARSDKVHRIIHVREEESSLSPVGGDPIWNRRGSLSESLSSTPRGDQSGRGLSKF